MRIIVGDITDLIDVDIIVNAANGVGPMGRGVAGAIAFAGGPVLTQDVRRVCDDAKGFNAGECYVSKAGNLSQNGVKAVYHAVTMKYPGGPTSLSFVEQSMRNVLEKAIANGHKSLAFPGLGTGVGRLDKNQVAKTMVSLAESYSDRLQITIIDRDKEFIDYCKKYVKTESDGNNELFE